MPPAPVPALIRRAMNTHATTSSSIGTSRNQQIGQKAVVLHDRRFGLGVQEPSPSGFFCSFS
jgi:hypothetical protein